jgi:hypothetical protein
MTGLSPRECRASRSNGCIPDAPSLAISIVVYGVSDESSRNRYRNVGPRGSSANGRRDKAEDYAGRYPCAGPDSEDAISQPVPRRTLYANGVSTVDPRADRGSGAGQVQLGPSIPLLSNCQPDPCRKSQRITPFRTSVRRSATIATSPARAPTSGFAGVVGQAPDGSIPSDVVDQFDAGRRHEGQVSEGSRRGAGACRQGSGVHDRHHGAAEDQPAPHRVFRRQSAGVHAGRGEGAGRIRA